MYEALGRAFAFDGQSLTPRAVPVAGKHNASRVQDTAGAMDVVFPISGVAVGEVHAAVRGGQQLSVGIPNAQHVVSVWYGRPVSWPCPMTFTSWKNLRSSGITRKEVGWTPVHSIASCSLFSLAKVNSVNDPTGRDWF